MLIDAIQLTLQFQTKMTKLTVLFLIVLTAILGNFNSGETVDTQEDRMEEQDDPGRSGAARALPLGSAGNRQESNLWVPTSSLMFTQCYGCTDCPKILPNTPKKGCSPTYDPNKTNKCVVYAEKYNNMANPWVIRGCVSERGTCAEIEKAHEQADVKLNFCVECIGDNCNTNGVDRSLSDLMIAALSLTFSSVLAKKVVF